MSDDSEHADRTVILEDATGEAYECRILSIFEFEGRDYALLLRLGDLDEDEDRPAGTTTTIMRVVQKEPEIASFSAIESDEEFDRVIAYLRQLAITDK
jgi:uncharacterized protein YrzB (UPF0473 family)